MMPNTTYGMIPTYGDFVMINLVLQFCHATPGDGHYGSTQTTRKVLDCGFYWPTNFRDAYHFVSTYENAKKLESSSAEDMRCPNNPYCSAKSLMSGVSTSWGHSQSPMTMSRWVEAIATKTNDVKVVVDFLKSNIFCRFGMPKALISDQGSHFCNRAMSSLIHKYGVVHRISTAYNPKPTAKPKFSIGK
ncbi:gag-pol, partial [Mucuna pruriens]